MVPIRQDDDIWKNDTAHDYVLCTKTEDGTLVVVIELVVPPGLCVYRYGEILRENVKALLKGVSDGNT